MKGAYIYKYIKCTVFCLIFKVQFIHKAYYRTPVYNKSKLYCLYRLTYFEPKSWAVWRKIGGPCLPAIVTYRNQLTQFVDQSVMRSLILYRVYWSRYLANNSFIYVNTTWLALYRVGILFEFISEVRSDCTIYMVYKYKSRIEILIMYIYTVQCNLSREHLKIIT